MFGRTLYVWFQYGSPKRLLRCIETTKSAHWNTLSRPEKSRIQNHTVVGPQSKPAKVLPGNMFGLAKFGRTSVVGFGSNIDLQRDSRDALRQRSPPIGMRSHALKSQEFKTIPLLALSLNPQTYCPDICSAVRQSSAEVYLFGLVPIWISKRLLKCIETMKSAYWNALSRPEKSRIQNHIVVGPQSKPSKVLPDQMFGSVRFGRTLSVWFGSNLNLQKDS